MRRYFCVRLFWIYLSKKLAATVDFQCVHLCGEKNAGWHLFYTSVQVRRNARWTPKSLAIADLPLLLQGILLWWSIDFNQLNSPQVTVSKSARSCAFRALMSRGVNLYLAVFSMKEMNMLKRMAHTNTLHFQKMAYTVKLQDTIGIFWFQPKTRSIK